MSKQLLIASLVSIAILAVYYSANESKIDAFGEWKGQFGANWAPEEEAYRRIIFEKNLVLINKHNADHTQTYKMGVNQFSVFTTEEFAAMYLTAIPATKPVNGDDTYEVIGDVDWTTQGKVSPVKNQASCGSCWAFSATGVLESYWLQKGTTISVSEQQLVDCSRPQGNQGCNGGWPSSALNYVKTYGITTEAAYPYVAKDQACKTTGGSYKINGYVSYNGCTGIQNGLNAGPVSVTVDATNWSPYRSGVFNNCASNINHAVLLVGVAGGNWKIKNSWGTSWGESGFIRLAGGSTCGVCQYAGIYPN
jgi:hypothetical protein